MQKFLKRTLAQQATHKWSAKREFQRTYKEAEPEAPPPIEIDENKIILGHSDELYTRENLVMLNLNRVAQNGEIRNWTCGIFGVAGSGKSRQLINIWFYNFCLRLKEKIIVVDPQKEYSANREENPDNTEEGDALLKSYNVPELKRTGFDIVTMSAYKLPYKSDIKIKIVYPYLKYILQNEPDEGLRLVAELLGIEPTNGDALDILRLCLKPKFENWNQFRQEVMKYAHQQLYIAGTKAVLKKLNIARRDNIISTKESDYVDICKVIMEHQVLVIETSMRGTDESGYIELANNSVLKIILSIPVYAMQQWNVFHNPSSPLHLDHLAIVIDEVGQLAGTTKTTTSTYIVNLVAKMRKAMIDFGMADQSYARVAENLTDQCKVLLSSQLTEANIPPFRAKNVPMDKIRYLQGLSGRIRTSVGSEVPWWIALTEEGEILEFLPEYMLSRAMKSTK